MSRKVIRRKQVREPEYPNRKNNPHVRVVLGSPADQSRAHDPSRRRFLRQLAAGTGAACVLHVPNLVHGQSLEIDLGKLDNHPRPGGAMAMADESGGNDGLLAHVVGSEDQAQLEDVLAVADIDESEAFTASDGADFEADSVAQLDSTADRIAPADSTSDSESLARPSETMLEEADRERAVADEGQPPPPTPEGSDTLLADPTLIEERRALWVDPGYLLLVGWHRPVDDDTPIAALEGAADELSVYLIEHVHNVDNLHNLDQLHPLEQNLIALLEPLVAPANIDVLHIDHDCTVVCGSLNPSREYPEIYDVMGDMAEPGWD